MRTHAALGLMVMVCGTAFGQNALDKPLDKNTRVGGGRMNTARPDLNQELRMRNAVVTGNAPGGMSFRGDVGYLAPGEFFGALGSNDTFSFRRDSYYSGLGGLGIRGTDAIQYQFAMTTGNAPPPGFLGAPTFSRNGGAVPAQTGPGGGEKVTPESGLRRVTESDESDASQGLTLMSLRSPAAFAASRSLEPITLGRQATGDGRITGVSASPLLGLSVNEREDGKPRPGAATSVTERVNPRGEATNAAPEKQDTKADTKVEPATGKSGYDDLMERIKAGGEKPEGMDPLADPKKQALPQWQTQLDDLRKQLGSSPTRGKERPVRPGAVPPGGVKPEGDGKKEEPKDFDPTAIERIRNAAGDVKELAAKGFDAYGAHMEAGQEHIAAGRFFYAEERFTAALSLKAGDPMAAIGRVHAQLGAGMFLSAAINLRSLFTEHPEVVSLKFQAALLPPPDRIAILQERLSELAAPRDGKHRDLGLLSAYLGFQSGNAGAIKSGLALMAEPPALGPDEKPADGPDQLQKLAALLTKVWMTPAKPVDPGAAPIPAGEPSK